MQIQKKRVVLAAVLMVAQSAFVASAKTHVSAKDNIYAPKVGSKERTAILHAARQPVLKFNKVKYITFTGVKLRSTHEWAYVDAHSVDSRGRRVGPDFTNELAALVRKTNGRWSVVEWAYATDVISMGWETKYPQVPKRLWPHNRR